MSNALEVVVVRVLGHPTIQERPGKVIHGILLVLNSLGHNLSIEVVVEAMVQMRFHWQGLVQKLLEQILLGHLTHNHCLACRSRDSRLVNDVMLYEM